MKKAKKLPGFTLIELLIVIAIIGVLAVAFLPTLLEAPAKGRDTSRIADLQKIQKVLVNANLEGKAYPNVDGEIADGLGTGLDAPNATWGGAFNAPFGGKIPVDPQAPTKVYKYEYQPGPGGGAAAKYSFALYAKMEVLKNANANCANIVAGDLGVAPPADSTNWCYVIFTQ